MEASGKASAASGTAPRRIIFTFCNLLREVRDVHDVCDVRDVRDVCDVRDVRDVRDGKRKPKSWSPNEFSHLAPKNFQIFRNFPCSYS